MTQRIPPFLLAALDNAILWQHRDPIAFFEEVEREGAWQVIWPARLGSVLAVPILFALIIIFREQAWVRPVAFGFLAVPLSLMWVGGAVTIMGSVRFWLLYTFSLPLLVVSFLCGLALVTPIGLLLGWIIGLPLYLGTFLADAGALWVYKQAKRVQSKSARQRAGGLSGDLPALRYWQRVRLIRLALAILLIIGAIAILLLVGLAAFWLSVAMLFAAAGCLHLDATLLALFTNLPLVTDEAQYPNGRTTYIGRHALFVPQKEIVQTITPEPEAIKASAALLTLLREGTLAPLVRQAFSKLSEEHAYTLLLHLSLHEGGAEALRFLEAKLPQPSRQIATFYADLAQEAAKPLDLQRWIALLPAEPNRSAISRFDRHRSHTLAHAREALLGVEDAPIVAQAGQEVQQLVAELYPQAPPEQMSWPIALQKHLFEHQRRLLASR